MKKTRSNYYAQHNQDDRPYALDSVYAAHMATPVSTMESMALKAPAVLKKRCDQCHAIKPATQFYCRPITRKRADSGICDACRGRTSKAA